MFFSDRSITEDEKVLDLAKVIIKHLQDGEVIFLHCRGTYTTKND
jgi:glucan phosphoethanolaminetransferase (alkaline phosphatase superfamily)